MTIEQRKILRDDLKTARMLSNASDPIVKAYWTGRLDALIAVDNTIGFSSGEKSK